MEESEQVSEHLAPCGVLDAQSHVPHTAPSGEVAGAWRRLGAATARCVCPGARRCFLCRGPIAQGGEQQGFSAMGTAQRAPLGCTA